MPLTVTFESVSCKRSQIADLRQIAPRRSRWRECDRADTDRQVAFPREVYESFDRHRREDLQRREPGAHRGIRQLVERRHDFVVRDRARQRACGFPLRVFPEATVDLARVTDAFVVAAGRIGFVCSRCAAATTRANWRCRRGRSTRATAPDDSARCLSSAARVTCSSSTTV